MLKGLVHPVSLAVKHCALARGQPRITIPVPRRRPNRGGTARRQSRLAGPSRAGTNDVVSPHYHADEIKDDIKHLMDALAALPAQVTITLIPPTASPTYRNV